ncbi:unnamed protein product, partial [Brenthis ino]
MKMSVKVAVALLAFLAFVDSQSLIDALIKPVEVPESHDDQPNRNCLCKGPACVCCVDFNVTFLNLGGPGCVHMKYISPEEGFSVKVSYDKSLLHSSKIKGSNPAPVCLGLFGKHAEVCAKFNDLAPTSDGLRGCLEVQLRLLGDSQLEFPIGCFRSSAGGMEMEDPPAEPEAEEETTEESTTEDSSAFDAEAFLLNIYQTAEQGVAFLGSLLDLPAKKNETTTIKPVINDAQESESQRRSPKHLKHPNQL